MYMVDAKASLGSPVNWRYPRSCKVVNAQAYYYLTAAASLCWIFIPLSAIGGWEGVQLLPSQKTCHHTIVYQKAFG